MAAQFALEGWMVVLISALVIAIPTLLIVTGIGYARPARKQVNVEDVRVGAAALVGGAFATLGRRPGIMLGLVALGAAGSVAADGLNFVTSVSTPGNVLWWIVNSMILFYWHRAILLDDARAVGFDVDSANLIAIVGRSWLVGLLLVLTMMLAALPALLVLGLAGSNTPALAAAGGATGLAAILALVWNARFTLTFPATAVRQPEPGVWEMHRRAAGVGVTLTAAFTTLMLLLLPAMVVLGVAGDWLWSVAAPEEWADAANVGIRDAMFRPTFRAWEFLIFNVPMGVVVGLITVLGVSMVSIAYRRWILPEHAGAPAAPEPGLRDIGA